MHIGGHHKGITGHPSVCGETTRITSWHRINRKDIHPPAWLLLANKVSDHGGRHRTTAVTNHVDTINRSTGTPKLSCFCIDSKQPLHREVRVVSPSGAAGESGDPATITNRVRSNRSLHNVFRRLDRARRARTIQN